MKLLNRWTGIFLGIGLCFMFNHVYAKLAPVIAYADDATHLSKRITRLENQMHYYEEAKWGEKLERLTQRVQSLEDKLAMQRQSLTRLTARQIDADHTQHQAVLHVDQQLHHLSDALRTEKKARIAQATLRQAARPSVEGIYQHALTLMKKKRYKAATTVLEGLIRHHPKSHYVPDAYYWLGSMDQLDGKKARAQKRFKALIKRYPNHPYAKEAKQHLSVLTKTTALSGSLR